MTNITTGEIKTYERGECIEKPTFRISGGLSKPFLQAFANELHKLGIKPEKEPVLENELAAVKYHLEDMRTLVFQDRIIIEEERRDEQER